MRSFGATESSSRRSDGGGRRQHRRMSPLGTRSRPSQVQYARPPYVRNEIPSSGAGYLLMSRAATSRVFPDSGSRSSPGAEGPDCRPHRFPSANPCATAFAGRSKLIPHGFHKMARKTLWLLRGRVPHCFAHGDHGHAHQAAHRPTRPAQPVIHSPALGGDIGGVCARPLGSRPTRSISIPT
jgi:hypothetical protein